MKKLCSSVLAVSISLIAIALSAALYAIVLPLNQPIQAQTQNLQQQELLKLLDQAVQQTQQGQAKDAIAISILPMQRYLDSKTPI